MPREPKFRFHREWECSGRKTQITPKMMLLSGGGNCGMLVDLKTPLQFKAHSIQTDTRPEVLVGFGL